MYFFDSAEMINYWGMFHSKIKKHQNMLTDPILYYFSWLSFIARDYTKLTKAVSQ